jgi:hypothetical protein
MANPDEHLRRQTMRTVIGIVALLCVCVPAALAVPPAGQDASRACKAQRNAIGMSAFRLLYSPTGKPKAAMDACRAQQVQLVTTEEKNAAKACKAERGTTPTSKAAEAQLATLNAAKACKAERGTTAASREAFAEKYGTNATNRNAFGKCVSKLVPSG